MASSTASGSPSEKVRNLLAELQQEMDKPQESPYDKTIEYLEGKGKLKQWGRALGMNLLQRGSMEQQKMIEAENKGVCKAMGWDYPESEDEEMPMNTVLGDVTYPTPVVIQAPQQTHPPAKSGLGTIAALLLGMGLPTAGFGGYALNNILNNAPTIEQPPAASPEFDDESVRLRLLREADLSE